MRISDFNINQEYPFNQFIETESGTRLRFQFPEMDTDYKTFGDVLESNVNLNAWNEFIRILSALQVVYNKIK